MKKIALYTIATALLIGGLSFQNKREAPEITIPDNKTELTPVKNEAFKRGEKLTFKVRYGFIEAGKVTLDITDENLKFGKRNTLHVVALGTSQGMSDWFFKVRDRYESYIDEEAILPWMFIRRVQEGGYSFQEDYTFNRYTNTVKTQRKKPAKPKNYDVSPDMHDMISAFYKGRTIDFTNAKKGQVYTINCFVDEEAFPIKIKFIGRERIKTKLGKFNCLKFRPIVQKGRVFKNEDDLNVWVSDDKNHVPIKAKANILVGSIQIELSGYSGLANPISKI